jgi:hypothetical protein
MRNDTVGKITAGFQHSHVCLNRSFVHSDIVSELANASGRTR